MDPLTGALIVGGLGSAFNAFSQNSANRRNLRAQQERQRQIDSMFAGNRPPPVDMGAFMNEYARSQNAVPELQFERMSMPGTQMVSGPGFQGYDAPSMIPSFVSGNFGYDPASMSASNVAGNFGYDAATADMMMPQRTPGQMFNAGQDALMQSLRADPLQLQDNQRLTSIADTGLASDVTGTLDALTRMQDMERERAMAEIRGASGSVGQRFGSAVRQQEQRALEDILTANAAQRAQLALGVSENAANRRLTATQQLAQNQLTAAQLGLSDRGLRLNAAQALTQFGLQGDDFSLRSAQIANQAAQFNAANINQARQFSAGNSLQLALANQQANMAAGQFNANAFNQSRQFGATNAMQMALANQQSANVAGQFNAQQLAQAGQFNAGTALQAGQFNASLAAQQMQQMFQNQFNVQNANNQFALQFGQQNFANQLQQRQFGLSALQAGQGLQMQRQGLLNQQLIAQAGQAVPQAQPNQFGNALGDIGQLLLISQMMGNRSTPSMGRN